MKQRIVVLVFIFLCSPLISLAQAPTAVVNGQVRDTSGAALPHASVEVINDLTNVRYATETNDEGVYSVPNLPPGSYHIRVSKTGFKVIVHPNIILNVQDAKAIGFTLPVGPISDTVTVEGGAPLIDTESAAVSTVVDRQFAENLPMNGRSFQTLIQLTPGVVLTASNYADGGQFSVNGQRAASNYWTVDGVSANIGVSGVNIPGNGFGGALPGFSAQGGTNGLVSVDALQEFRIQTSTFAPEFGRTPGGQISIVTRSGTNQLHGTLFEYFRNDALDANDWFADKAALPKPQERQNDFGGTVGGPLLKNKFFFFFSYEGLRLRLPQVTLSQVPDIAARQSAVPALQPYLNAFPLPTPNRPDNLGTGIAEFDGSYSNSSTLSAYSLRLDHKIKDKLLLFGRYNYAPSNLVERGLFNSSLSSLFPVRIKTQTGTAGVTWTVSPLVANDLRFNYSKTNGDSSAHLDNFDGAIPLTSVPFPPPFTAANGQFLFFISRLGNGLREGKTTQNVQKQVNIVDSLSFLRGSHNVKVGIDFRRLSPIYGPQHYTQQVFFRTVSAAGSGTLNSSSIYSSTSASFILNNLSTFAQDSWRIVPRLTATYGLRWDVDFAPSTSNGPNIPAVTGYTLTDLSQLALAPPGTPPFKTTYGNLAPRLGIAYQLRGSQRSQTVLRGGFGLFYDLATSEVGNALAFFLYPFGANRFQLGGTFPLSSSAAAPPAITAADLSGGINAFDPNLKLPYTLQWNVAIEQALGEEQAISVSYVGADGRRLLQTADVFGPNATIGSAQLVTNTGISSYNALQVQFQRRLSRALQTLASYSWSHSIDTGSAGSLGSLSNLLVPGITAGNRGPSDFDVRHAFSAAITYAVPLVRINPATNAILTGWSVQSVIQARSASPVDIFDLNFFTFNNGALADVRPDLVPGQSLYLFGLQYPGGKAFNPAAFTDPPSDPNTGNPLRQGTTPRNFLRGFGAAQWDFAVHRDFPIHESLRLQFRAELFNVLNHPNFGPPVGDISNPQFGLSTQMLGPSFNNENLGGGAFSPLYQIGGPRSVQLALKLQF